MTSQGSEADGAERPTKRRRVIHAQDSDSVAPQAEKSRLLALPPELRTLIYEYVLTAPDAIMVTAQLRQPAMLQVCRTFRSEAFQLWYDVNLFEFQVWDCDATLVLAWYTLWKPIRKGNIPVGMEFHGEPDWSNLLQWCKRVCEGGCIRLKMVGDMDKLEAVIAAAHSIALRHKKNGWPWRKCKEALEDLRFAVGTFEKKWLQ